MQNNIASDNNLRLTPNFKATFLSSQLERSVDNHNESDSLWDLPQKSSDFTSSKNNKVLSNTLSRRSASSKQIKQFCSNLTS